MGRNGSTVQEPDLETEPVELDLVQDLAAKLPKGGLASISEARSLVDAYYQMQDYRKAQDNQVRALESANEPATVLRAFAGKFHGLEREVKKSLDQFSMAQPLGVAVRSVDGIGPVIAAGLLAHIDIVKAPTAGHIWRFGGLDPSVRWEKGQKRPWNAALKVLLWKAGESFVKRGEKSYYGRVYIDRKRIETEKNAAGQFSTQAAEELQRKKYGKTTEAFKHYTDGHLPPAHVHARAKRYAVKLFLSHYHHVAYLLHFGQEPPRPYVLEHLGHAHYVGPAEAGWTW